MRTFRLSPAAARHRGAVRPRVVAPVVRTFGVGSGGGGGGFAAARALLPGGRRIILAGAGLGLAVAHQGAGSAGVPTIAQSEVSREQQQQQQQQRKQQRQQAEEA